MPLHSMAKRGTLKRSLSHRRLTGILAHGMITIATLGTIAACSPSDLTNTDTPSNIVSSGEVTTPSGALAVYRGALTKFSDMYGGSYANYTLVNGMLADEFAGAGDIDLRTATAVTEESSGPFKLMATTRLNLDRATNALRLYAPAMPTSLRGEMHALKGYIYVMAAELYCSGVPFSTVTPDERVVLGTPLSTTAMLQAAIAQFDSAITLAADSVRVQSLAKVGKGRALMDLGDYPAAAQAVATVPASYVWNTEYAATSQLISYWFTQSTAFIAQQTIADREGTNGLPFSSAADPRLALFPQGTLGFFPAYLPAKFVGSTSLPIPLANGIEAQLIKAEAQLKAGDAGWLATLNALRTTCTTTAGCATPAPAGSGAVAGLPPLEDPSSDTARVSLVMRERAFWLFGTGHRTGDLRRLVRQYGRPAATVFPVGTNVYRYSPPNTYGELTNLEPPQSEHSNPHYQGCLNRDA